MQGFFSLVSDVTASKRAEQDARFLADASAALAGLVDDESTLQKLARLAVPHFADWCTVDVLDEGDTLRRVAVAHVDPAKVELARELHRRYPPDPAAPQGVWNILRTGKSELIPEIADDLLAATVRTPTSSAPCGNWASARTWASRCCVRGKVLGVITFIAAESGRRYGPADLAVAEDLAHRAAVAVENARLYQEVREADRRKDEFLAVLGHELRNPLAPISNALQLLKLPGASGPVAEQAREMMERQVQHMVRLVDDLLDVSRIVRGKVELRREPVELAAVVARAVETAQPLVEAEGHELTVDPAARAAAGRAATWCGWRRWSATCSTTPPGTPSAAGGSRSRGGERGASVVLRVRDTGIGIAAEALPRIWDLFVQADRRVKGAAGRHGDRAGAGQGAGRAARRHGRGSQRGAGQGQRVRRDAAAAASRRAGRRLGPERGDPPAGTSRRVLVVDDNVDAAESLALLLRLGGHEVRVAHDGPAALALAEADPPEVALLDLGMPGMDGYELAGRFRGHPALRDVLLVALTGWGQAEDRRRTAAAGFDHHLVKPVEPDRIQDVMRSLKDGGR